MKINKIKINNKKEVISLVEVKIHQTFRIFKKEI